MNLNDAPIAILWRFRVRPDRIAEFRQAYGPDGAWAELFGSAEGYRCTELLECDGAEPYFITIDRWRHPADFIEFKRLHQAAYEELDRRLADLTVQEEQIGVFRTNSP